MENQIATHPDTSNQSHSPAGNALTKRWKAFQKDAPWISWVLTMVGVAFLVLVAFVMWRQNLIKKEELAKEALFKATQILEAEQKQVALQRFPIQLPAPKSADAKSKAQAPGNKKDPKAAPEPDLEMEKERLTNEAIQKLSVEKFDVKSAFPRGVAALEEVAAKHSKQIAGVEAMVHLSNLYARHGDNGQAFNWAVTVVNNAKSPLVEAMGFAQAGYLAENTGKYAEAYEFFDRATKALPKPASKRAAESLDGALQNALGGGVQALMAEYYLGMGRAQEKLGNAFLAKKAYEKVLQEHPNSDSAKIAELSIQDLGPIVKEGAPQSDGAKK